MPSENPLLEVSPCEVDRGALVGRHPSEVPPEKLNQKFSAQNPLKAIRGKCIDCSGGIKSEVRKCTATGCSLWPFRMSKNPFRKRSELSDSERELRAARLHQNTT